VHPHLDLMGQPKELNHLTYPPQIPQTYSCSILRTERRILWRTLSVRLWNHLDDHLIVDPDSCLNKFPRSIVKKASCQKKKICFKTTKTKQILQNQNQNKIWTRWSQKASWASLYEVWDSLRLNYFILLNYKSLIFWSTNVFYHLLHYQNMSFFLIPFKSSFSLLKKKRHMLLSLQEPVKEIHQVVDLRLAIEIKN